MRLLLVSTYELGHQPLGIASPARLLEDAGHEVRCRDLAVESFDKNDLAWCDAVLFSVPMHTALRLALEVLAVVRVERAELPVALYGLYATAGAPSLRDGDLALAGEVDDGLLAWIASLAVSASEAEPSDASLRPGAAERSTAGLRRGPTVRVDIGPARPLPAVSPRTAGDRARAATSKRPPARGALPGLSRYARLLSAGSDRLVGSVETTRGCSHRCRHCPVPTVYDGRTRLVDPAEVLADIDQLVAMGAGHIHFADPDFLNRPAQARRVVAALHARHPELSFDATIKVSHVLAQRDTVGALADAGCVFVVSAFESTSELVLRRLDKGHTSADAAEAVRVLRDVGIEPRPSFLPFTPWTTLEDVAELLDFVAAHDLVESVDPVQYGIRLLVPPGSLLLADPDPVLAAAYQRYDAEALGWTWVAADRRVDELQRAIALRTEEAAAIGEAVPATYAAVRSLTFDACGLPDPGPPSTLSRAAAGTRPHLSETWFCCAEPTARQLCAVRAEVAAVDA